MQARSYDLLGARPGSRILDVGCGLGDDAAALAARVAQGRCVIGVDGSRSMVDAARNRHHAVAGLTFEVADAGAAIAEMVRVLRPGGVVVVFDNDWEMLTVDSGDRTLTRRIVNAWCDRFPSGWIGRHLVALFLDAGLFEVAVRPKTLMLNDFDVADRGLQLCRDGGASGRRGGRRP